MAVTANLYLAANILKSVATNSPGSLLQAIAFFIVWAGCWFPLAIACAFVINWRPPQPLTTQQKLPLLASLYAIAPLVLWLASRVLNTSFSNYGFVGNLELFSSLAIGFVLGVFSLVILFALQTALGWINWQKQDELKLSSVLLPTLLLALYISGIEELIFRGFLLTQLQQDFVPVVAAVISSAIFALLHLIWEQRETLPQLPGLWLMGMVLVLARWVNGGSLGLAWGLHTGWVWAIACLDTLGIVNYTGTGSEWVTGRYGKPLAGVVGIGLLLVTGGILWFLSVGTAIGVF